MKGVLGKIEGGKFILTNARSLISISDIFTKQDRESLMRNSCSPMPLKKTKKFD